MSTDASVHDSIRRLVVQTRRQPQSGPASKSSVTSGEARVVLLHCTTWPGCRPVISRAGPVRGTRRLLGANNHSLEVFQ